MFSVGERSLLGGDQSLLVDCASLILQPISTRRTARELLQNLRTYLRSTLVPMSRNWCPGRDLNPHSPCGEKDFKSFASASFATRAHCYRL